ncbi:hypothetical protein JW777_10330 [bacterium]|nr:hypothetical protein [bacterium]
MGRYKAIHRCKTSIGVVPASFIDPAGKNSREIIVELPDDEAKAFGPECLAPAEDKDVTWPVNGKGAESEPKTKKKKTTE